jgi:uncharacterized protein (TIGR02996 family)
MGKARLVCVTEVALGEHLDANPTDWQARREYADWLLDEGRDSEAALQRWLADNEKAPARTCAVPTLPWDWFYELDGGSTYPAQCRVSQKTFIRLSSTGRYRTRRKAEADLLRVLIEEGVIQP